MKKDWNKYASDVFIALLKIRGWTKQNATKQICSQAWNDITRKEFGENCEMVPEFCAAAIQAGILNDCLAGTSFATPPTLPIHIMLEMGAA